MADLSQFWFNPLYGWANASANLLGRDVQLMIHHAGETRDVAAARATEMLDWISANAPTIFDYCADELLTTKNHGWTDDNHLPVDRAQFVSKLRIDAIEFLEDRTIKLVVDAADLFWGHWIVVYLHPDGRPFLIELQG